MRKLFILALTCLSISIYAESSNEEIADYYYDYDQETVQKRRSDANKNKKQTTQKKKKKQQTKQQNQKKRNEIWLEEEDYEYEDENLSDDEHPEDLDDIYDDDQDEYDESFEYEYQSHSSNKHKSMQYQPPKNQDNVYNMVNGPKEPSDSMYDEHTPFRGFQFGLGGTFGKASAQQNQAGTWTGGPQTTSNEITRDQFPFNTQIGYDYQRSWYFIGAELQALWFVPTIKSNVSGALNSQTFYEFDSINNRWQLNLNFHLGLLWTPETVFYAIIGPAFSNHKVDQDLKTVSMSSGISSTGSKTVTGYNIGLGMGTLITDHFEMHLNGAYIQNPSFSVEEIHTNASDNLSFKTNSVLVLLNFLYRL